MKNVIIFIEKEKIFSEVSINTAYTGCKGEDNPDFYNKVATVDADKELLSHFFFEICGKISELLKDLIQSSVLTDAGLSLTLLLSNSYDDSLTDSLTRDLISATVAGVCARWLELSAPQRRKEYETRAEKLLNSALSKLYHRKKPMRK